MAKVYTAGNDLTRTVFFWENDRIQYHGNLNILIEIDNQLVTVHSIRPDGNHIDGTSYKEVLIGFGQIYSAVIGSRFIIIALDPKDYVIQENYENYERLMETSLTHVDQYLKKLPYTTIWDSTNYDENVGEITVSGSVEVVDGLTEGQSEELNRVKDIRNKILDKLQLFYEKGTNSANVSSIKEMIMISQVSGL